jgi:hypothetical protein
VNESEAPVSYICDPSAGVQRLTRYWNYTFVASQPTSAPAGSKSAIVATGVSACSVSTQTTQVQTTGIVIVTLTLKDSANETITLLHQAQVDNSQ